MESLKPPRFRGIAQIRIARFARQLRQKAPTERADSTGRPQCDEHASQAEEAGLRQLLRHLNEPSIGRGR